MSYEPTSIPGIYRDDEGNLALAVTPEQEDALMGKGILRYACNGQAVAMLDAQIEE